MENSLDCPAATGLRPLLKWAGGKEKELCHIIPAAPAFERYFEPFVGGGAVYTAFRAPAYFINDKSDELISLYRCVASQDVDFFSWLETINHTWRALLDHAGRQPELVAFYSDYRKGHVTDTDVQPFVRHHLAAQASETESILQDVFSWHRSFFDAELHRTVTRKLRRMRQIESTKTPLPLSDVVRNIETAYMGALYTYFRRLYNDAGLRRGSTGLSTALFVFIRDYAYSGMFRYNDKGEFNVPYGGMGYNHKSLDRKIGYYRSRDLLAHMEKTVIENLDFEAFLHKHEPAANDFVFLDPPYDSEFSTYARNAFTRADQLRLAAYLLHECKARWMLVIKHTPFIRSLYDYPGINIRAFDKRYLVSFMNRNDKQAEHLVITNN